MRLDLYLTAQGLAVSRTKAKALLEGGCVCVNGQTVTKAAHDVTETDDVLVIGGDACRYVGRGGVKLDAALAGFELSPEDAVAIDIGASSGGFTDCLLQHGARLVYAVDSGTGQLHPTLREDARVVSMEGCNARYLTKEMFSLTPTFAVMDVSFISQTLILPVVFSLLAEGGALITLIKPQFEAGRAAVGKGGIVKREKDRLFAISRVVESAKAIGFTYHGHIPSPITGGDGNQEYLAYFRKP